MLPDNLSHRETLSKDQIEYLNEKGTEFYRMLAGAAHNGVVLEFVAELYNQLNSGTWGDVGNPQLPKEALKLRFRVERSTLSPERREAIGNHVQKANERIRKLKKG